LWFRHAQKDNRELGRLRFDGVRPAGRTKLPRYPASGLADGGREAARQRGHARRRVLHRKRCDGGADLGVDRGEQLACGRRRRSADRGEEAGQRRIDAVEKATAGVM